MLTQAAALGVSRHFERYAVTKDSKKLDSALSTFGSLLQLTGVFLIALKLSGVITWSWLWVLLPMWGLLPVLVVLLVLRGGVALAVKCTEKH